MFKRISLNIVCEVIDKRAVKKFLKFTPICHVKTAKQNCSLSVHMACQGNLFTMLVTAIMRYLCGSPSKLHFNAFHHIGLDSISQ